MEQSPFETNPDGSVSVRFDSRVYPLNAVKKAAYKFAKDCGVVVNVEGEHFRATINFFDQAAAPSAKQRLVGAFCNEVIDQDLREQISEQTEPMRNLILAQAFSKTSLLNND